MLQNTKPKTIGVYRATVSGHDMSGRNLKTHFAAIFNQHGLVYFLEENEEIKFTLDEIEQIKNISSWDHFTSLTAYHMDGNKIKFKYYEPASYADYQAGVTNPKMYREFVGEFKDGNLYLKYFKSGFSDAYREYIYEQTIPQTLCFSLHPNY